MLRLLRNEPRAALLLLALVMANLLAWGWAWHTFSGSTALMAASLLAWCYGLRHAVDADHIAAIDTVTRKMMQQGKRPSGVGAWFSLGHSTIVVLASIAIAATATAFQKNMAWFHETGSLIGTAVSATFLLAMALVNMVILRGVWRSFQALKRGRPVQDDITLPAQGGVMNWLFGKTFRLVNKSWQMYWSVSCSVSALIRPPDRRAGDLCRQRVQRNVGVVNHDLPGTLRQRHGAGGYPRQPADGGCLRLGV